MRSLCSRFNALPAENKDPSAESDTHSPPPSVFGIIVVGLLAGLVVGLLSGPDFTLHGFFLGFAGGALITAGVCCFSFLQPTTTPRGFLRPRTKRSCAACYRHTNPTARVF